MRVLITGALGFIGSHLADEYIRRGDEVWGIDDLSGNVVDSVDGMRSCAIGDARQALGGMQTRVDLVVHAASPVGPVALLERSSIVAEIVETTLAAIRFCQDAQVPLVNISSSEVYGRSGVSRETDDCIVPARLSHRLQYAAGKLAGEQLVRTSGIPAVNIRPFNVAGPRQSRAKGFVLPTFCEQAIAGEPLTVFDGGGQQRCLTAVWDVCRFITAAGDRLLDGEPVPEVVNVGATVNRTTVLGLAERVIAAAGSKSGVKFTTGKAEHGPLYEEALGRVKVPDTREAERLGWRPTVGLEEMIERTLAETRQPA